MLPLSRRKFLGAAAGAAGLALAGRAQRADAGDDKLGGFLMGIQSYSLRGYPVDEALQHVHEFGLHSVEFTDGHFSHASSPEQIDAMKRRCA
ncbi:MAG TPA: twin-arginine translocation signal domain-containing protein, partial [Pirellulales bacterium]|nr:twin-arginine translocation signal domain-containing protein [Pirellulales bacterium]